jgi:hypothetical protein
LISCTFEAIFLRVFFSPWPQVALPAYFVPLTQTLRNVNVAFITQYLVKPAPPVPSTATRAVGSGAAAAAAMTMAVATIAVAMTMLA